MKPRLPVVRATAIDPVAMMDVRALIPGPDKWYERILPRPGRQLAARSIIVTSLALALAGCSAAEFYWQGVSGQVDLMTRARPIPEVVRDIPDGMLKTKLAHVQAMRAFASRELADALRRTTPALVRPSRASQSRELALPDNGSYTRYADVGRQYVVWNV